MRKEKLCSCSDCGVSNENATVQKRLEALLSEALRLYEVNGRQAYESGRIDGVKWAIEEVRKCSAG